jgi:hypothetical protein
MARRPPVISHSGWATVKLRANGATLHAGSGPDILYGAPGETMFGGTGPDVFAFEPGFGNDTIINFHSNNDALQFDPGLVPDFKTMIGDAKQVGTNTVITVDPNDTITLQNVKLSSLMTKTFGGGSAAPAISASVLAANAARSVFSSDHTAHSQLSSQISDALAAVRTDNLFPLQANEWVILDHF